MAPLSAEAEFALWARECGWDPAWDDGWDPADSAPPEGSAGDEVFEVSAAFDPAPVVAQSRLALIRDQLAALSEELPAAARSMGSHELLAVLDAVQESVNVVGFCDQVVVAQIDRQGVHETDGAASTAELLIGRLRVRPSEAARRVRTARGCAERVGLDGQVLPPSCPQVAAAQAAGTITSDHAAVIDRALDRLPVGITTEQRDGVEAALVELATKRHASDVAVAGRAARELFDPDGPEPRDRKQHRLRSLRLSERDDGTTVIAGELTPVLAAKLRAVLDPLAAPRPSDANGDDTRNPDARFHDALEDVCDRLLASGTLPDSGGCPATVAVTISFSQLQAQLAGLPAGRVRTDLGVDLSVPQLLQLACEAEILPVVLNDAGGIMSYGRTKRFATKGQTKAMRARDRGCSFPKCRRPPQWCQRHHVVQWLRDHGFTDIDKLILLCGYHHHHFEEWGWDVIIRDGVPWWIPPAHLDPERKPVQNTAHHDTELVFA